MVMNVVPEEAVTQAAEDAGAGVEAIGAAVAAADWSELISAAEDAATQTPAVPTETPAPTAAPVPQFPAQDITMACALNGYTGDIHPTSMRDNGYKTYWESVKRDGVHSLTITSPAGQKIGGVLIRWKNWPLAVDVQEQRGDEWVTIASCDADFVAQYIEIPASSEVRVISRDDGGQTKLEICEITVVTPGALPEDFQVWRKAPEKIDLMLFAGHPDDEVLWFGGLLPTYAGEQGRDVLVVCAAHNIYYRRLELCDCLWACGVDVYPEFLNYTDLVSGDLGRVYEEWHGVDRVRGDIARLYRQYQPDVVVLHAVDGETGHGVHRALSQAARDVLAMAASADAYPETAGLYGTWDVPKVYVHLWPEHQIQMDWHVPLTRFGGLSSLEVAALAFEKHISQASKTYYSVKDGGETDNSLFGLYYTTVGYDAAGNDLFEHIPPRGE